VRIPFHKPCIVGKELEYVTQVISSGDIAADGHFTRSCSELLENKYKVTAALMTPSCTAALELAGMVSNLRPGDEVILPSFTFPSTVNASRV
jgi:dTDP-4-amino-4,6-dideoxygalactose transaminase